MKCKFDTNESWTTFRLGKTEIIVNSSGTISHAFIGKRLLMGRVAYEKSAEKYIDSHPRLKRLFSRWLSDRKAAIAEFWETETAKEFFERYSYECDGGSLAVRINGGAVVLLRNYHGDGSFSVYVGEDDFPAVRLGESIRGKIPPTFEDCGVSIRDCEIEILDYDCEGGNALLRKRVKRADFLADGSGRMVVLTESDTTARQ